MKKLMLLLIIPCALLLGILTASAQMSESQQSETVVRATWSAYKPETIEGKISMIVNEQKLVVITSSEGVPYNFVVTKRTKIEIGGMTSSFADLGDQTQNQATVTFVPRRDGNIAQSISVSG